MSKWLNLHNFQGVHNYVSQNSGTVGLISWSQMCDAGDPEVKKLREAVTVVPLFGLKSDSSNFYPVQSAIADGEYPLTKKLYLITTEPFSGPATGFAAFVASSEGQRIIRLFGIQPASIPTREIIIN
jgi:phosphate transport system substrate-binding protein